MVRWRVDWREAGALGQGLLIDGRTLILATRLIKLHLILIGHHVRRTDVLMLHSVVELVLLLYQIHFHSRLRLIRLRLVLLLLVRCCSMVHDIILRVK